MKFTFAPPMPHPNRARHSSLVHRERHRRDTEMVLSHSTRHGSEPSAPAKASAHPSWSATRMVNVSKLCIWLTGG